MMKQLTMGMCALGVAGLVACTGDTGPAGPAGETGATGGAGVQGEPGPITSPPRLQRLSPTWGSATTRVTITGENFSATAGDNRVTFDGYQATVITATATSLVVEPSVATAEPWTAAVAVEVANQMSNPLSFQLVPSGHAAEITSALPTAPTGAVQVGGDVYVAAGNLTSPSAGLYKVDSTGATTRVWTAPEFPVGGNGGGGPTRVFDSPMAVASNGTDVFFLTALGRVRRYEVATGDMNDVLGASLGGDSNIFPARSGIAFDSGGYLYVVDRTIGTPSTGGVLRVAPDGTIAAFFDQAFGTAGSPGRVYGITSDGASLFLSNPADGEVVKVTSPQTSFTVDEGFANGATNPQGITVVGTNVVVSTVDGTLMGAPAATGGSLSTWGHAEGYNYQAQGMATNAAGDVLLAQSEGSTVRRIASGGNTATIVTAGVRLHFGTTNIGDSWYVTSIGFGLFGNSGGPAFSAGAPDGAVIELTEDGTSRVVYTSEFPVGVVATGTDELTVSDCFEQRVFTLVPSTGAAVDRLSSSDGIGCPAGMVVDAAGDLFYVDSTIGGGAPSTIGKLTAAGVHTEDYVTGLGAGSIHLVASGTSLLSSSIGPGNPIGVPIFKGNASAGGAATMLTPAGAAGLVGSLGVAPDGTVYLHRFAVGDLATVNPTSGEVTPLSTTFLEHAYLGQGSLGSTTFSMGFKADGTLMMIDSGQGVLMGVAP